MRSLSVALVLTIAVVGCASEDAGDDDGPSGDAAPATSAGDVDGPTTTGVPDPTTGDVSASTTTLVPVTTAPSTVPTNSTTTSTSTSTSTTSTSTTCSSTSTTTQPSDGSDADDDLALIDLESATLAGWPFDDGLIDRITTALGAPMAASGWLAMPPKLACTGNLEYRETNWGNVRVVEEREAEGEPIRPSAWSVGLAPPGIAPSRSFFDLEPTGVTTTNGVGIGDPVADIDIDNMFGQTGPFTWQVAGARAILISTDADDRIVGFSSSRNDCIGLDIAYLPCDRPVPIFTLPDGSPTGEVRIDDDRAIWGGDPMDPEDVFVVERLGGPEPDSDTLAIAVQVLADGGIRATRGPLRVAVVPIADPPVGQSQFFLFDDRSDCIRQFWVSQGLDPTELENYASRLIDEWNPQI
jgi:hypothetical protein